MKFIIRKEIEAKTIKEALDREKSAEIVDVYKKDEPQVAQPIGFQHDERA